MPETEERTREDESRTLFAFANKSLSRRNLIRGGVLGVAGLTAAALIGCGDDDDDDDVVAPTPGGGETPAGEVRLLNQELVDKYNDPNDFLPFVRPEPDVPPKKGGIWRANNPQKFRTFDTTQGATQSIAPIVTGVAEPLLRFAGGAFVEPFVPTTEPNLAQSFETTPDGLKMSLNLTDKAKFHDVAPTNGRAFTAVDAKANIDRYKEGRSARFTFAAIRETAAVDDTTLVLDLTRPALDLGIDLAARGVAMHAPELFEGDKNLLDEFQAIGTGPWILEEFVNGGTSVVTKNPSYWKHEVLLDGLELSTLQDSAAILAAFRTGKLPYVTVDEAQIEALRASNPDVDFIQTPVLYGGFVFGFDLTEPPFNDDRVRQALSLAMNRQRIIDIAYGGRGLAVPEMAWPFLFDQPPTAEELGPWWRLDLTQAKQLLDAAGVPDLAFNAIDIPFLGPASIRGLMVDHWGEIGVELNLEALDGLSYNAQYMQAQYEEAAYGWISYGGGAGSGYGPDTAFWGFNAKDSPLNFWYVDDPQLEQWGEEQAAAVDPDERREILRKIWDRALDKMYRIAVPRGVGVQAYHPWARNFRMQGPVLTIGGGVDELGYSGFSWIDK